jgi:type IV pilus assembly protein PilM
MAPMALYNYALFDYPDLIKSENQATVILDIGAENSDLVVCTQSTVWQRCVPMGGNAFTKAIADTFKLNFEKAEKLKRTAPMSKYARQVFQAMKPIFTDLASEIQRSLGFYNSSNPNTKLLRIIALGGGTKMRGLLQYLRQTLQIPVEIPDSFKRLTINPSVSAAKFHESVSDFGVVYGLALQGLGLARIESNLLPRSIARSMAWAGKTKYFTAAAAAFLLVSIMCFARTALDRVNYATNNQIRQKINNIINTAEQADSKLKTEEDKGLQSQAIIEKEFKFFDYRDVVPLLHQTIISVLPNEKNNPEQKELYRAFATGDVKGVLSACKERKQRKQIFITGMSVYFSDNIASAQFGAEDFVERGGTAVMGRARIDSSAYERDPMAITAPDSLGGAASGSGRSYTGGRRGPSEKTEEEAESAPGFVVTITGYSPYKDIGELMDPIGVEGDPNKWGVVTRLLHLDNVVDWKNQFELYKKTKIEHFKLQTGEVDLAAEMPVGIGIEDTEFEKASKDERKSSSQRMLIDPMTREVINKVAEIDENGKKKVDRSGRVVYRVNDHWFKLDAKFIWKGAPKEITAAEEVQEAEKINSAEGTNKTEKSERHRRGDVDIGI